MNVWETLMQFTVKQEKMKKNKIISSTSTRVPLKNAVCIYLKRRYKRYVSDDEQAEWSLVFRSQKQNELPNQLVL